ncbi:MAG: NlpC/P60 family protein [Spirochaetaceae bacterium]|nr:NlpC/P60 family protein [Spirochaetaceae bacterium]
MSPVHVRAVGRHRRPTTSRLPHAAATAATAALSGILALTGASTAGAHDTVRASASGTPTLRYDSAGDAVRDLQKRLGVPATGWFGPDTREAVRRFETENGLVVNGVVGRRTWAKLSGETPAPQADIVARPASRPDAEARAEENRPDSDRASRGEQRPSLADRLFEEAARHVGKPYSYGSTGPGSFDCSGFTGYVFRQVGINLPRSSQDQRNAVPRVSAENARPGDLMFSHDSSGRVFHVAIYAGDGRIWDSPRPGETVGKRAIWTQRYTFGRPATD